jgi:hypothetical protein
VNARDVLARLRRASAVDRVIALLVITGLFGVFVTLRLRHAGQWLPALPDRIGEWKGADTKLPDAALDLLGRPKATARVYTNPLGEKVAVNLVAAGSFDAYHDPTICYPGLGYNQTAEKLLPMKVGTGDGHEFRAMVYRGAKNGDGVVMFYWLQHRDGGTDTDARLGTSHDAAARLRTGFLTIVGGHQTVIVRVLTLMPPGAATGAQEVRNVRAISEGVRAAILAESAR